MSDGTREDRPAVTITFPLAVIDFEASSFSDERSYPIEVGVAIAPAPSSPILVWSSLIQPTAEWVTRGDWNARSAKVHGISARELEGGSTPEEIAHALNRIAAFAPRVWCDGGEYDLHWHCRLFEAARVKPAFQLQDLSRLFASNPRLHHRFAKTLATTAAPHRAGADAARIGLALLGRDPGLPDGVMSFADIADYLSTLSEVRAARF